MLDLASLADALDALPEAEGALASEAGRVAYVEASEHVLAEAGWAADDFLLALCVPLVA